MNIYCLNEGDILEEELIEKFDFEDRDCKKIQSDDLEEYDDIEKIKDKLIIDFVGFIKYENDLLVSFPKKFTVEHFQKDSQLLFKLLLNFQRKRNSINMLYEKDKDFKSNYPFKAFSYVYEYYLSNGEIFNDIKKIDVVPYGKINWKKTINNSNVYLVNDRPILFPFYYDKNNYIYGFLNECMCYCIDLTISNFQFFMNCDYTHHEYKSHNIFSNFELVVEELKLIKSQTFKDTLLNLIDYLIIFYSQLETKATFSFKNYSFYNVWEVIVMKYLNDYFTGYENNEIVLSSKRVNIINFKKKKFFPNQQNGNHYIELDYYYRDENVQYILDAKYKNRIKGIDYKQVMYYIFLEEYIDEEKYDSFNTFSTLVLPSKHVDQKIHFEMNELMSRKNDNVIISELYLDIKQVIENYLY